MISANDPWRPSAPEAPRPAARQVFKSPDLLESEQKLIKLMEDMNFGRIERLQFRNWNRILHSPPRTAAPVKMTSKNRKTESKIRAGSCLQQPFADLLALMKRVGEGEFLTIDVRHGLPFSVEIEWLENR